MIDRIFDPQSHRLDGFTQSFVRCRAGRGTAGQIGCHHAIGASLAIHQSDVTYDMLPLGLPTGDLGDGARYAK